MQLSRTCLQWTIIVYNTLCVVVGILGVVESVFELQKYSYGTPDFTEKLIQICMGSVLVISAFVGCCAAVNGSVKILSCFTVMLMALIAAHLWMLWLHDEDRVRTSTAYMVNYFWLAETYEQGRMNYLQETYDCCGIKGYLDYNNGMKVPESCYYRENDDKSFYLHEKGCLSAVEDAYLSIYRMEKWAHVSLIGFEVLGISLGFVLIYNLTADNRVYTY